MADVLARLGSRVPRILNRPAASLTWLAALARDIGANVPDRLRSGGLAHEACSIEFSPLLESLEAEIPDGSVFFASPGEGSWSRGVALRWGLLVSLLLHGCLTALLLFLPMHPQVPFDPPFLVVTFGSGGSGVQGGGAGDENGGGPGGGGGARANPEPEVCAVAVPPAPEVPEPETPTAPAAEPSPPEVREIQAQVEPEPVIQPETVVPVREVPKPEVTKPVKKPVKATVKPPERQVRVACAVPTPRPSEPPAPAAVSDGPVSEGSGSGPSSGREGDGSEGAAGPGGARGPGAPGAGGRGGGAGALDAAFGTANGPRFLHRVLPSYPKHARRFGKEGTSLLCLTIDERGKLVQVEVLARAGSGFDEEAVRAVRESTFSPAIHNGKPVSCRARLPVRFMLKGAENDS